MTQYLHPSVDSKIVDNSFVYQTADGTTALFQVIMSSKGPDNVLTRVTDPSEFIFLFGEPNVTKYGQPGYNVLNWLKAGGVAYVIRVVPSTTTYAVGGLFVELETAAREKTVKVGVYTEAAITSKSSAKEFMTANTNYTGLSAPATVPLGLIIPKGRGTGYNTFGFRLSLVSDYDTTYDFRTYHLTLTTKDDLGGDVTLEGPYLVAFDPQAKTKSRESLYWASVLNRYSKHVEVIDNPKAFDQITSYLLEQNQDFNPAGLDFIFKVPTVKDAGSPVYADIVLSDAVSTGTAFKTNGVNAFVKGTEGEWTGGNSEESLMVRAYQGLVDSSINDPHIEFDVVLDGNLPVSVKNAMAEFASNTREDTLCILDLNFQANEQQTLDHRMNKVTTANRAVAIFAHDMEVFDSYSGQNIKVTTPYILATTIPTVDNEFGVQYPFVGPRRGIISGVENINFIPNATWRETFYSKRINYIERDPRKINLATQLTSQSQTSALSDINNMRSLFKIRREVTKLLADYRMEFADDTTYESINYNLNNYLQTWVANRACSSISGVCYASDYDKLQKLARVDVTLQFTGIIERFSFQLIVNR